MEVNKVEAKMEILEIASSLMPKGVPAYLEVVKYPKIENLITEIGKTKMIKVIFLMVKDFCNSLNVVRNMNEDQMIEAAAMLIDECGNFRLEDYVMMFQLGKRGELVKIMDRVDLQVITAMLDEYWVRRKNAAERPIVSEINSLDNLGSSESRSNAPRVVFNEDKGEYEELPTMSKSLESFASSFEGMKNMVEQSIGSRNERGKLAVIEKNDTESIKNANPLKKVL